MSLKRTTQYNIVSSHTVNDLWRYGVKDNTWTWMSGVNPGVAHGSYGEKGKVSVENYPRARSDAIGFL